MILSVVVPLYNQNSTIEEFYREIRPNIPEGSEIIFVDDGSTDGTMSILRNLAREDRSVKIISLGHISGISAALAVGFAQAKEDWIVTIGADLQSDPVDIGRMAEAAENGYDMISGHRKRRRDSFLGRQLPDTVANTIISLCTGVWLHDYACPLKIYRSEYVQQTPLLGEMHRFLPACVAWNRGRFGEASVKQRPYVESMFPGGIRGMYKVILDIFMAKYFLSGFSRPLYLFGRVSLLAFITAVVSAIIAVVGTVFYRGAGSGLAAGAAVCLLVVSLLCFVSGFIAEIAVRGYSQARGQAGYHIREKINC